MIRISCKNERFTYDMYHIVKSFLPDAEISQKVDPEQELLIEMTAEEEPDLEEQACDKKVRWTFLVILSTKGADSDSFCRGRGNGMQRRFCGKNDHMMGL